MARTAKNAPSNAETKNRQKRDRGATERRLINAALELIRKNGVLAGLNLREVAAAAGVNRGSIYHYFGSRQELLRNAINRRFDAVVDRLIASNRNIPFVARRVRSVIGRDRINDTQLRTLLILDGDDSVDPMPQFEAAVSRLRQDVIDGDIDRSHDLEALHATLIALSRGYRIFRSPMAKRMGISAKALDDRVGKVVEGWLTGMVRPAE